MALDVPFGRFFEPVALAPEVIRAGDGPSIRSEQSDYVGTLLAACGAVRCGPVGQTVALNLRDYVSFPGDVPHVYEALTENTALAMVMEHTSR